MVTDTEVKNMTIPELQAHAKLLIEEADYGPMLQATLSRLNDAIGSTESLHSMRQQVIAARSEIDKLNAKLAQLRELIDEK